MYYLYKITNKVNHKIYIGQTNNPKRRWEQYKYRSQYPKKYNQYIYYAMHKDGIDNFIMEMVAFSEIKLQVNVAEIYLIKYFNSRDKNIGYNINVGGEGGSEGRFISEQTRQKLSKAGADRTHTKETKMKIATSHTGIKSGPLSEEHKQKLSKIKTGKKISDSARHNISKAKMGDKNPAIRYRGKSWKVINGKRVWMDK